MGEHALPTNLANPERFLALRRRAGDDAPDVDFRRLFDGVEDAARGRAEAQEELLNGELAQRVKNTLSVVQAIAPITMLSAAPAHLVSTTAPTGDQTGRIEFGRGLKSAGDVVPRILIRYCTCSVFKSPQRTDCVPGRGPKCLCNLSLSGVIKFLVGELNGRQERETANEPESDQNWVIAPTKL